MEINSAEKRKAERGKVKLTSFQRKVYFQTQKIPKGKVLTYGTIAKLISNPNSARAVGNALHKNPFKTVPCHRVVNRKGELAKNFGFKGRQGQRERLLKEKIEFKKKFKVNLEKHLLKD